MSDTAISPGIGAIEATGNAPVAVQSTVMQPAQASIEVTGLAPYHGLVVMPEAGSISVTGLTPDGYMWASVADAATTWTVVP